MELSARMPPLSGMSLCDFVEWRESHKIRIIKDIAAAVGLLLWAVIPVVETVRLWKVFTTV
jgi:hypothetical protein